MLDFLSSQGFSVPFLSDDVYRIHGLILGLSIRMIKPGLV